jgi:predicted ATP-grasp superfamily ATP-dependent carboligase
LPRRLKILLTEGSSLSARHTLYALGGRYLIDVCDPRPWLCLARFSRFVRKCHRCPPFAADPLGYKQFLLDRLRQEHYDVLLPTHDQVYLCSKFRQEFAPQVAMAVPEFAVLQRLQSKSAFANLFHELNLPQPETRKVSDARELKACAHPSFVKLPFGTAGSGVWHVETQSDLDALADRLQSAGITEVVVQQPAPGTLCVAQAVFQQGRLLAAHTYQARAMGVGGSARARISVSHPIVLDHLRILGTQLNWHGALMLDYLFDSANGPMYIEANPRIGETVNALLSGLNLCELLVQVALDRPIPHLPPAEVGTRTHSVLMGLLALAQQECERRELLAELWRAGTGQGIYAASQDEVNRVGHDFPSLIPALFLTMQLLFRPRSAQKIVAGAVQNYALTEKTWKALHNS